MFSLKFDLLFPSIRAAKQAARNLNAPRHQALQALDPREVHRRREELRAAREAVKAQLHARRYHVF
jgi:hypothetical protein